MSKPQLDVLQEARDIIHGARNKDYGHPLDNHGVTAALIESYLARKHGCVVTITAEDVCVFNILQKVSRLAHTPEHRDSLVDIAGYSGNIEMIQDERRRRG